MTLPIEPEGRLAEVLGELNSKRREAFVGHLLGGTSADWLARTMKQGGVPIGATTIKRYRAAVRDMEGR